MPEHRNTLENMNCGCHALAICCCALPSCAGLDTTPCELAPIRSTLLDDTGTAAAGGVDWEAGVIFIPNDRVAAPTTVKWGVTDATELSASWVAYHHLLEGSKARGVGNASIAVRHRFADETDGAPAVLGRAEVFLPVGDPDVRVYDRWGVAPAIALSKSLGGVAVNATYQVAVFDDPDHSDPEVVHVLGVMASTRLGEHWFGFAEYAAVLGPEPFCNDQFVQVGAGYQVSDHLAVDFGAVAGFGGSHDCDDLALTSGVTFSF